MAYVRATNQYAPLVRCVKAANELRERALTGSVGPMMPTPALMLRLMPEIDALFSERIVREKAQGGEGARLAFGRKMIYRIKCAMACCARVIRLASCVMGWTLRVAAQSTQTLNGDFRHPLTH